MNKFLEVVTFNISNELTKEEFIEIVEDLENNYHSKQEGFIDTELAYDDKNDSWLMIQHWSSQELMKQASINMFKTSCTKKFVNAVIPTSVKMISSLQLKEWTI